MSATDGLYAETKEWIAGFDVVGWLPKMRLPQSVGCFPNPSGHEFPAPPGQVGHLVHAGAFEQIGEEHREGNGDEQDDVERQRPHQRFRRTARCRTLDATSRSAL